MTKATITNLTGERERITLPVPLWTYDGGREHAPGIKWTGLFRGPRTGRMFLRVSSIWDRGDGVRVGEYIYEMDLNEFLGVCRRENISVPGSIPAIEV